ncbi:hypothetical protein RND81_11G210300 [Saponaria officinalis]|uniref:ZF-HD dimerization-type domain-containing protein n=1 Tax=Saponaria officinalis TaxID=3572 RepID=A0AAW1HQ57_SAPOF
MIRYMECQRNHAAHLGSHVVDGCGEFMPAGNEGTPPSLRCAACNCHRSFHRREDTPAAPTTTTTVPTPRAPIMVAFGPAEESSSEDMVKLMEEYRGRVRKKRFRTKFTEEQKAKMAAVAEEIGWRMKNNEEKVVELCSEIGIRRKVFKVWMHNNKQVLKRKHS